jgi:hypothetical protein
LLNRPFGAGADALDVFDFGIPGFELCQVVGAAVGFQIDRALFFREKI